MSHAMQTTARDQDGTTATTTRRCATVTDTARAAAGPKRKALLARAVSLIDSGRPREADLLLTGELLRSPRDSELWLAAGLARVQRGCLASAAAALRMCHWLSGDALARELIEAIGEQG